MIQSYPDGSTIELGHGDTYPPGHVGQHTGCIRPWVRRDDGPWRPLVGVRSTYSARVLILAAETAGEAWAALRPHDDEEPAT